MMAPYKQRLEDMKYLVISGVVERRFGHRDSWSQGATTRGPWKAFLGLGQD